MEIYDKVKLFKFSNIPSEYTAPITLLCMLNAAYIYRKYSGINSLTQLIVPVFFMLFSGPLVANIIYPYFVPGNVLVLCFFLSHSIFLIVKQNAFVAKIASYGPVIGKLMMICDMKNRNTDINLLIFWILISNFVGSATTKFLCKNPNCFKLTSNEIYDISTAILCVFMGRMFRQSDITLSYLFIFLEIANKMKLRIPKHKIMRNSEIIKKKSQKSISTIDEEPTQDTVTRRKSALKPEDLISLDKSNTSVRRKSK